MWPPLLTESAIAFGRVQKTLQGGSWGTVADQGLQSPYKHASILFAFLTEPSSGMNGKFNDGSGRRKAIEHTARAIRGVSRDDQWLVGSATAFPLAGGPGIRMFAPGQLWAVHATWTADRKLLFLSPKFSSFSGNVGRTYIVPLPTGKTWPEIPEGGFETEEDIAKLPGVRVIEAPDAIPGPTSDIYAFSRETTQRNLYRIPVP
jgi:hypothetical protein